MTGIHALVVNINGLKFTRPLLEDLFRQTEPFALTVVDQGSTEAGTDGFFDSLRRRTPVNLRIIRNSRNVPLNWIWNDFYESTREQYLCLLNNDLRIPGNFVRDTMQVLEAEETVGIVLHATNCPDFQSAGAPLRYEIATRKIVSGHAFTIRREAFTPIPVELGTFGGDDWLFHNAYANGWRAAVVLSSPIIHYHARSRRFFAGDRDSEALSLKRLGVGRLPYYDHYIQRKPTFDRIEERREDEQQRA